MSKWADSKAYYLELWSLKEISVNFYLAEQNRGSLEVADNPFKLEVFNTLLNFTPETSFLVCIWTHLCCQSFSWTPKTKPH